MKLGLSEHLAHVVPSEGGTLAVTSRALGSGLVLLQPSLASLGFSSERQVGEPKLPVITIKVSTRLFPFLPWPCSLGERCADVLVLSTSALPRPPPPPLEEHIEISMPLCLLVPIPDFQWRTREWTFLQQSVISCPRVPLTSSPAPSAPVAWIATANGKAAPPTTSKALRLFPWLNLVSVHGHGTSRGQLLFLLEEGSSFCKGIRMKDSTPGGHTVGFFPLSFPGLQARGSLQQY